ncbi:hypothetical protein [Pedobacter nanyangensis]|uniref:hypothetical protein n=1 Tax=Pedobacter nanyangensis TaxID=1562389 RepID=UPI000DE55FE0|nr:hypothetical protein [Pedobacter nanyangensis]
MEFEYKALTANEWSEVLADIANRSVFGNLSYLESFEQAYGVGKKLVGVYADSKPYLLITFFEDKGRIVCPNHYYFQFVWEKESSASWRKIMVWEFLMNELKKRYSQIHFRLPLSVHDVRPFEWAGFTYQLKHTYIKTLDERPYHQNLKRILAKKHNYTFGTQTDDKLVWSKHRGDLKAFLFSASFISKTIAYFEILQQKELVATYNIYADGGLLSSIIVLIDKHEQKAYFPLIGKIDLAQSGAAAYLYDYAFSQLKKQGIKQVDLYGANMKSIARFKHKFEPELERFFEVEYNHSANVLVGLKSKLKEVAKKIVRS